MPLEFQQRTSELDKADRLRRSAEEKFAKAFRSVPVGVAVTRMSDGKYIDVNETLAQSVGYKRSDMLGKTTVELGLWVDLGQREALMAELAKHGSAQNVELKFRTRTGEILITEFSGEVIEIDGEQCLLGVLNDITDHRRIEEALKANEELLRQFVKHTPAAIAMFDNEMRYLQVSDRFLTDYHLEDQNLIGKCHYDVFPDLPQRWRDVHKRILNGAQESCDEDPYIEPDGSQGWLQWESLPWRKAGGEIGGLILFTQVITGRKRAELAVKASEKERQQLILELGERVKELTALHQTARILQDETKDVPRLLQSIVNCLTSAWQYPEMTAARISLGDMEFTTPDFRKTQWSQQASFSVADTPGEIEVVYLEERPAQDIGPFLQEERNLINSLAEMIQLGLNRRFVEKALRESEEIFRTLAETVSAGIYIHRDMNFVYVNPSAEHQTGYSRDELLNMTVLDVIHPDFREVVRERVRLRNERKLAHGRYEDKILTKDGNVRWLAVMSAQTTFRGEAAVIVATFDVTERKRTEMALKVSQEQLRALSAKVQSAREEEGARIAREIHDELGSSLTGLKWDLESLESSLKKDSGEAALAEVRKRIGSMTGLVNATIQSVRRISSELRPGVLDHLGLVAAIEWQGQQFQNRTGISFHWDTSLDTVEVSHESATAVFRIFQEVLTNVLRHAQAKNVYVKLNKRGRQIELEVRDDGRGITEREKRNPGSLGLLGMKERALLVKGEVLVKGENGKGTTVVVRVPVSSTSDAQDSDH